MIVTKFGGTALSEGKNWQKVLNILKSPQRSVVVVSAPGARFFGDKKVTDLLYQYYYATEQEKPFIWQTVSSRFFQIADFFNVDVSNLLEETRLLTLDANLPYVVSRGEYLSAKLFALISQKNHVESAQKIKFDGKGNLLPTLTEQLLIDAYEQNPRGFVLGGFYGSDCFDKITLFERGGSDVTGALVASALNADLYENWTDVSGFFVCDPRIVLNPAKINCLSFEQLKILSTLGASVLHPKSVYPAQLKNLSINIKNVFKPHQTGTLVVPTTQHSGQILGIVSTEVIRFDLLKGHSDVEFKNALYYCKNCGFCTVVVNKNTYDGTLPKNDGVLFKQEATLVSVLVDDDKKISTQLVRALTHANLPTKILCDDFGLCMCLTLPNSANLATNIVYDYFFN